MTTRLRIHVDQDACQGSGLCAGIAPGHFIVGNDYRSHPVHEVVDASDDVRDAAECCPLEAITLTDADTGQPVS